MGKRILLPKNSELQDEISMKVQETNPLNDLTAIRREILNPDQWRQQKPEQAGCETSSALLRDLDAARIDLEEELTPPPLAITSGDQDERFTIGTIGNVSLVIGKAKSKKTFFVSVALAAAAGTDDVLGMFRGHLPDDKRTVLFFDTEQARYHVHKVAKRICRMMGVSLPENFKAYCLRKYSPNERINLIKSAIEQEDNLGFVVIDGVRDLVTSINDEEQSTTITSLFLKLTEERQFHLMTVLHQNKSDNNARGHIGTELINKCETVLSVTQQSDKNVSVVETEYSRDQGAEPFAFEIDDHGIPQLVKDYVSGTKRTSNKKALPTDLEHQSHALLLRQVFSGLTDPHYSDVWKRIKECASSIDLSLSDNAAKGFMKYYTDNNYLKKTQEGTPIYSLNLTVVNQTPY